MWAGAVAHAPLSTPLVRVGMCLAGATNAEDCDFEGQGHTAAGVPIGTGGGQTASASNPMQVAVNPSIDSVGQVSCHQVACAIDISDGLGAFPALDRIVPVTFAPAARRHQPDGSVEIIATGEFVFKGNDVYSATATSAQTKTRPVAAGGTGQFGIQVQNDGRRTEALSVRLTSSCPTGFEVHLFSGASDVTARARAGTLTTPVLASGTTTFYSILTKAPNGAASGATCAAVVTARTASGAVDAVRAKVKVA